MSFYSNYEDYNESVEARFTGETGAVEIFAEALRFEEDITLEMLQADYREAKAIKESASAEEIEALTEGTVGDVWKKIKDFFIKFGQRIKAFVLGWVARIRAKFTSNNKKFYNKYKDQVKRTADDLELEYRKTKDVNSWANIDETGTITELMNIHKINNTTADDKLEDLDKDMDQDEIKNNAMKKFFKGNDVSFDNAKDDLEELAYSDSSKENYKFGEIKDEVVDLMSNGDTNLEKFVKIAKKLDDTCRKTADNIRGGKSAKNSTAAARISKVASIYTKVASKGVSAITSIYKEQLSQARTAFAKAVQYHPKD